MITLITGLPGAGKTAYAVSWLSKLRRESPERIIFAAGVTGLQLEHEVLPEPGEWVEPGESANGWRWRFPPGSVLVLDEAQSIFRPRPSGSAVPPHVAALETHRHAGLDVVLITQAPGLIDSNVRRLVGRHVHVFETWAGRRLLEWAECVDPSQRGTRAVAVSRPWRLPKAVFSSYESSSLHIKAKRRVPWQLGALVVLLGGLVVGGVHVYGRIYGEDRTYGAPVDFVQSADIGAPAIEGAVKKRAALAAADFIPRLRDRPESAPLYDDVRQVHQVPIVVGCVATATRCTCYTQQGTDAFLEDAVCRQWLVVRPFQPFVEAAESKPETIARQPRGERSEPRGAGRGQRVFLIEDSDRLASARSSRGSSD